MKKFLTVILLVILSSVLSLTNAQWAKYTIGTNLTNPAVVDVADIDGDTDMDVAATGFGIGDVVWYENGGGTPIIWTMWMIDPNLTGAVGVVCADIDNDTDMDVAAAGNGANDVVWYENMGGTPITWTKHTIDGSLGGAEIVYVEDIDGDTDLDIAATGTSANDVVWYENVGGTPINWTKHTIDGNLGGAISVHVADIDGDTDMDMAATGTTADDLVWYENGGGTPITWTKYTIDGNLNGAWELYVADIDGDTDLDVVATGNDADDVIWYENDGGVPISWIPHTIDANLDGAFDVSVADIDRDNDLDIAATGNTADDVVWYQNNLPDPNWPKDFIDTDLDGANSVFLADIDEDNWVDAVANSWNDHYIVWYENPPVPVELTSFTAVSQNGKVILEWTTATELNNYGFEVERKLINNEETSQWGVRGFKEGFGTTTEQKEYSFVDDINNVYATSIVYRLKQIDFDGSFEYSDEVLVNNLAPLDYALEQNYPNPFNPSTTITFGIPKQANVTLKIFNPIGQEVARLVNEEKAVGIYEVNFNASRLSSGIYFYQLQAGNFVETKKMILIK